MRVSVLPLDDADRPWAGDLLKMRWGGAIVVSRGRAHEPGRLPGLVAWATDRLGLLTYAVEDDAMEIVTLDSLVERRGVGSALVQAATDVARRAGRRRLWLVTTNDNTPAIRFYERRGFIVAALHEGAVEKARRLKPQIPQFGVGGAPIRDEVEMEMRLW